MGLRRDDFEWLTPAEFKCCIEAYNKKYEAKVNQQYELQRFNAWLNLSPNLKEGTEPVDLIRFEWEPLKKGKVINGSTGSISKIKSTVRRGE